MRPSIEVISTPSGHPILIDTALASSKNVLIAVIGRPGTLSSTILSDSHIAAFSIESFGLQHAKADTVLASDVVRVLTEGGFSTASGVVVVRAARSTEVREFEGGLEIDLDNKTKLDHVLSLLGAVSLETM